jgi:hypothetical protein
VDSRWRDFLENTLKPFVNTDKPAKTKLAATMPISDKATGTSDGPTDRGENEPLGFMWATMIILFMSTGTLAYVISVIVVVYRGK